MKKVSYNSNGLGAVQFNVYFVYIYYNVCNAQCHYYNNKRLLTYNVLTYLYQVEEQDGYVENSFVPSTKVKGH